ncbi:pentatricopeptide repeat-containing protein At3g24000, mitochondrial-like [Euphorbia lathyris]|uniref:pentatricopeptide repeat-containing protein At3g24000, mitochondrial-like n=1 Tax=Euphorbia lathyris TaxID=212925 RepID=UPI00331310F5
MECDFNALLSRIPSSNFRRFFPPNCSKFINSVKLLEKPQTRSASVFLSFRVKFSVRASPSQLHESYIKIPRKLSSPNWHDWSGDRTKTNEVMRLASFGGKEVLKRYSGMLRECASRGSLNQGKGVHGMVIKKVIEPDLHLWVSLINFYAKCRSLILARKVLDEMCERDVVSWTALIAGYVNEGCGNDAVGLYSEMRKENILPNEFAFSTVLKACSICLDVELGKQVHVEAIKAGLLTDLFVGSALVDLYAKCGEVELAERVFFEMPEKNDVSWNVLLNGYAQSGAGKEVLKLFCGMTNSEINFNKFTLSTVVKCIANLGYLREGRVLHSLAIRSGCNIDEFLGCCLIDMYSKCGVISDALKVFNIVKDPDVVAWSTMIAGLDQQGCSEVAIDLFHRMRHAGVRPNQYTLASVVSASTNMGDLHFGRSIHSCVYKYGLQFDNSVGNALITMYMKGGLVQDGIRVFESMKIRDLVSWNALLSGFHDFEKCDEGFRIFCKMLTEGLIPNMYTFVSVLRSCTTLLNVYFGKQVHAHIIKYSLDANDFVGTALIDMYAKTKCVEDADVAFHRLTDRDVFTWTVIISGHAQTEQAEKAVKYLGQMLREGIKPNEFTLASGLSGCSRMATLGNGQQLHCLTVKSGHHSDVFVASALVDMYGKCGCLEDAEALFNGLVLRDTVSWNIIISAYSQHGQGKKALEAFKMMLNEGIVPDELTFIGILAACSYIGLVEEGKKFFDSMSKEYGITPSIEHHACMVDILGRAGRFDEVEVFIEEMKLTRYSLIWETVLGACKLHGNVDLGKQAAKKLFELEPETDSSYILLSNIFAAKGKWDDVRNIRTMMFTQGVKKEPGCSWTEVDGHVHVFTSHDGSHPKTREIYAKLDELGQKLKSMAYVPKTETVLHNMSYKEKKEHLYYHSERLALAFALISTSSVKPIRIFKNLRICEDCHDVMKLISEITNRTIVIRDIKRFHHFKEGTCSCQDHW